MCGHRPYWPARRCSHESRCFEAVERVRRGRARDSGSTAAPGPWIRGPPAGLPRLPDAAAENQEKKFLIFLEKNH